MKIGSKIFGINSVTLVTGVIVLIVVVNILIVKFFEDNAKSNSVLEAGQAMLISANRISSILESETGNLKNDLSVVSRFNGIKAGNASECIEKLMEISPFYKPKISGFVRLDQKGVVYCSSEGKLLGLDRSSLPHVKEIFYDEEHKAVLSDFKYSIDQGEWSVTMHSPIFNDKREFVGTLGGILVFDELTTSFLKNSTSFIGGKTLILDGSGNIIYLKNYPELEGKNLWSDDAKNFLGFDDAFSWAAKDSTSGKSGVKEVVFENSKSVVSYASANINAGNRWGVLLLSPQKSIATESTASGNAFLLLYASSALTAIFLAVLLLTILNKVAKYAIEDLAEEIVRRKKKSRR